MPLVLNEAVNFEKKCIFVAIPKTGTTTIRTQLRQPGVQLLKTHHLNIVQLRDLLYFYFLKKNLGENKHFPSSSVLSDADIRKQSKVVFETFFKFSAVRNPWARAVSLYYRQEGVQVSGRLSFEEFCDRHLYASDTCLHPTLHCNQLDWICDESGECIMDYVYKLENFERAMVEIKERTDGRLDLANLNRNKNPKSQSRNYRVQYTEKTKKIIAKRFEKDIDYFKYVF